MVLIACRKLILHPEDQKESYPWLLFIVRVRGVVVICPPNVQVKNFAVVNAMLPFIDGETLSYRAKAHKQDLI